MRILLLLIIIFLFPIFLHDHIHDEEWYEIASYYASARSSVLDDKNMQYHVR